MSTDLSPDNELFIEQHVEAGELADRGDALNASVELLKRQREALIAKLQRAQQQLERGEYVLSLGMVDCAS